MLCILYGLSHYCKQTIIHIRWIRNGFLSIYQNDWIKLTIWFFEWVGYVEDLCIFYNTKKFVQKERKGGKKTTYTRKKTILTQRYMFCLARYKTKMIDDILIVVCVA